MNPTTETTSHPPIYRETQHFFRNWIFLLPVAAVTIIIWYEFVQQVVLGQPQGEEPIPNWLAWLLTLIFGFGFPVAGALVRLVTEVRPGELRVRIYPFRWVTVPVSSMQRAAAREYSPIREYGGWGVRVNKRNGRAYNAYGNQGVQLELNDGALVLIGSQRPQELMGAIQTAGYKPERKKPARRRARPRSHEQQGEQGLE